MRPSWLNRAAPAILVGEANGVGAYFGEATPGICEVLGPVLGPILGPILGPLLGPLLGETYGWLDVMRHAQDFPEGAIGGGLAHRSGDQEGLD
jgi:hypothetical protein